MYLNKTSPEPQMSLEVDDTKDNDLRYLSYVDEMHSKINSRSFHGIEPLENASSSELYSEHRLRSSSSETPSTLKLEETQGKLYVIKKINEDKTVKIPQLDLGDIIEKQKRKMYPFNINTQGELIEMTQKASSIDTHNDEDAIIIYDEQDQEDDLDSFKIGDLQKKHSNLFDSGFLSGLSSVHASNTKDKKKFKAEQDFDDIKKSTLENCNDMIMIDDKESFGNNNSFLDQDLDIDSIP